MTNRPVNASLFSNRCRKVTRRGIKIFAAYELFRIFWFFIWNNSNKNRTCIAIVTRRWSEVEMTRNSVKLYAISSETLSYPCEFNGIFLQFEWKKYISEFLKIISSFQKYSGLLFTPIITKISIIWGDVNMRTSNSTLRHMCVLSTRTSPKRSKRTTSYTRITMWSHLKSDLINNMDHMRILGNVISMEWQWPLNNQGMFSNTSTLLKT